MKSINIHFKRFLSLSLLPGSPVSDLAWRSYVYHEIKIKAGTFSCSRVKFSLQVRGKHPLNRSSVSIVLWLSEAADAGLFTGDSS